MKKESFFQLILILFIILTWKSYSLGSEATCNFLSDPSCLYQADSGEFRPFSPDCASREGFPLDFFEDWGSGGFEANNWLADGQNWSVSAQEGNPPPAAVFTRDPVQINYGMGLESYPLLADSLYAGTIYLDFDIKLDAYPSSGDEKMLIQLWNWENQEWITILTFSDLEGSFDWTSVHQDISSFTMGQIFKVRFYATGLNSLHIVGWSVDNIHVYRHCEAPADLVVGNNYALHAFELTWSSPYGSAGQWIHWDDGLNYDAMGTGGPVDFDVAARWIPDQLSQYENGTLKSIAFFPDEAEATYHIRVWIGAGAANLVIDQPVVDPAIGQWNTVDLITPLPIDVTEELWIGYYLDAVTGYPAGCDNGPAIDGYGNMINFGGWQTLLQMNPELDFNWNIKAFIQSADSTVSELYAVYRSDDGQPGFLKGYAEANFYLDDSICTPGTGLHEYQVTALYIEGSDTCESGYSNEGSGICTGIAEVTGNVELDVFPIPAGNEMTIVCDEMIDHISLCNYHGKLVFSQATEGKTFILPVKDYPEGVYLLRVETGKGVVSRKVIVMR